MYLTSGTRSLKNAEAFCRQALLPADGVHHVAGGRPARPRVALGKPDLDRVDGHRGKDQRSVGPQAVHGRNRMGGGDEQARFQRIQFPGEPRQL